MRSDRVTEKFTQLTTTVKTSDDLRRDCLCEKNYTLNTCLPEMETSTAGVLFIFSFCTQFEYVLKNVHRIIAFPSYSTLFFILDFFLWSWWNTRTELN